MASESSMVRIARIQLGGMADALVGYWISSESSVSHYSEQSKGIVQM
jgi:hypothetical protein